MPTERPFHPRVGVQMGRILVSLRVANWVDATQGITCIGMVDTGAYGLILPTAWKEALGTPSVIALVDVEMADQRVVPAEVCGPVHIQIDGFRRMAGEAIFVDMQPGPGGRYEPLVGYTVLESCNVVVDMVDHRLVARKYYDLKRLAAA